VIQSLQRFILESDKAKDYDWQHILKIFSLANSDTQQLSELIKDPNNNIIPLQAGWVLRYADGHATGVIYDKVSQQFAKINRGGRFPCGIQLFKVEQIDQIQNGLSKVIEKVTQLDGKNLFYDQINNDLNLKDFGKHIPHKIQQTGNCTWDSAKTLVRGILYFDLCHKGYSHEVAQEMSRNLYKDWTLFDRKIALNEFIELKKQIEEISRKKGISQDDLKDQGIIPETILNKIVNNKTNSKYKDILKTINDHLISA